MRRVCVTISIYITCHVMQPHHMCVSCIVIAMILNGKKLKWWHFFSLVHMSSCCLNKFIISFFSFFFFIYFKSSFRYSASSVMKKNFSYFFVIVINVSLDLFHSSINHLYSNWISLNKKKWSQILISHFPKQTKTEERYIFNHYHHQQKNIKKIINFFLKLFH